jgi:hypothetical protein
MGRYAPALAKKSLQSQITATFGAWRNPRRIGAHFESERPSNDRSGGLAPAGWCDYRIIPEKETAVAAGRAGVDLDFDDIWKMHVQKLERTAANKPSMLQDLEAERRTEIDAIFGGVLKYSCDDQEFSCTSSMYALLKAIDFSCPRWEDCRMGKSGTLSASGGKKEIRV